jgi:hypothetical protein
MRAARLVPPGSQQPGTIKSISYQTLESYVVSRSIEVLHHRLLRRELVACRGFSRVRERMRLRSAGLKISEADRQGGEHVLDRGSASLRGQAAASLSSTQHPAPSTHCPLLRCVSLTDLRYGDHMRAACPHSPWPIDKPATASPTAPSRFPSSQLPALQAALSPPHLAKLRAA